MDKGLNLSEMQTEAMKEVGNIGASHAATALSEMVDQQVNLSVPDIEILSLDDFEKRITSGEDYINYELTLLGEFKSVIILHFPNQTSKTLGSFLVFGTDQPPKDADPEMIEMMDASIEEVSNILVSHAADAFSSMLEFEMTPSVPTRINGIKNSKRFQELGDEIHPEAILLNAVLSSENLKVDTEFYLVPFKSSVPKLLEKLGVADL